MSLTGLHPCAGPDTKRQSIRDHIIAHQNAVKPGTGHLMTKYPRTTRQQRFPTTTTSVDHKLFNHQLTLFLFETFLAEILEPNELFNQL